MKRRDIVIGIVILALVIGAVYWRRNQENAQDLVVPEDNGPSVEEQMEERFKTQIPDDAEKAELKDETGGNASGISSRNYENNRFSLSLLADLPELKSGEFYQGWLMKGEEGSDDFVRVSVGKLQEAKGGWKLDFSSSTNYSEYDNVLISKETKNDSTPEETILSGSF